MLRPSFTAKARRFFLFAIAGLSIPLAAPSRGAAQNTPTVRITSPRMHAFVAEGETARLRIERDRPGGPLDVTLAYGGLARPGADFSMTGLAGTDGQPVVRIPSGQTGIDLTLHIQIDPLGEGPEPLEIAIVPGTGYTVDKRARRVAMTIARNDFRVTTATDGGEGSLRWAITRANAATGPQVIRFDTAIGPFGPPRTIRLESALPILTGELTIDAYIEDRLWKASGATVSGGGRFRVFEIAPGARVTLRHFTVANGMAAQGGGVLNRGDLTVHGVLFHDNKANEEGGGLANAGGVAHVINSTFAQNAAGAKGGGLANIAGDLTVTNATFSANAAETGGGLFNAGTLLLRNTILANSEPAEDCVSTTPLSPKSTHNLIERHRGCGTPIASADPALGKFGRYNGPTPIFPLAARSPAINLGDNASAVDRGGEKLMWDQRGSGDPRFVGGITDIGAFERQAFPALIVDTLSDDPNRMACHRDIPGDCSLRGAITLSNAMTRGRQPITFDDRVFKAPPVLALKRPLPALKKATIIDARGIGGARIESRGSFPAISCEAGAHATLHQVQLLGPPPPEGCIRAAD